jgi:hypothetical protein
MCTAPSLLRRSRACTHVYYSADMTDRDVSRSTTKQLGGATVKAFIPLHRSLCRHVGMKPETMCTGDELDVLHLHAYAA